MKTIVCIRIILHKLARQDFPRKLDVINSRFAVLTKSNLISNEWMDRHVVKVASASLKRTY